jgi:hypothetical protein
MAALSFCHTTSGPPPMQMTTYELFLCWIILVLLVLVVGEANIIKLGATQIHIAQ